MLRLPWHSMSIRAISTRQGAWHHHYQATSDDVERQVLEFNS